MERYLNHYQVDPVNWVSTAIHFLDARAILWWNRLEKLPSKPLTWADFKQQINTEFKPIFAHVTARDRFAVLKQGTSSVQDYVHTLQDILLEATDISDAEAIDHFVRNLKPQLYAKVRGTRPTTLEAAYKAAFDEEICHLPPGTVSPSGSFATLPSPNVDDPMDLSVAFNNLYCEWCRRKGHVMDDCRTKASAIDKFIKDHLQKNQQNTSRFVKRNNYNNNSNNNWKRRSNNHNQRNNDNRNNQLLNMLLDKLSLDDTSSSSVNKADDLIDLSSGRDEDDFSAYFPASSESVNVLSDVKFVLNVSSNLSSELPLYQAMIGGSHFKVLIDSGASANYVYPKLLHNAKSKTMVSTLNTNTNISNQTSPPSTSVNDATPPSISVASESLTPPHSTFFDIHDLNAVDLADSLLPPSIPTDDYLLSSSQLARLLKKNQISECFVINFAGADSDNTLVTPIFPPTFDNIHELHNVEVANASTGEQWKREFEKLFPYAFKDAITELPPHRNTRDIIVTNPTNAAPISVPPYRMSPLELKELRRQLNDLEKKEDALTRIRRLREKRFIAEEHMRLQGKKDKEKWDEKVKNGEAQVFEVGNYILLRHESKKGLEYNWMGPYIVQNRNLDFNVYKIKEVNGKEYKSWVHTDRLQLVKFSGDNISNSWYIPRDARAI
ncbi:hypothetical protein MUCCIDRAFT_81899 [Mucor lusitanicus CBS 277.49]|uniref:Retrotransposon gag domain-containing protein n=1 Tax=Mucor lusitanicus CBS 277.49 TaxID=747725 RepID=A0A168LTK6_MUCCL|nr:hypothetical protein MUCCIDRAFT_81899 [Mucor lusitanicus CBS 277.49]